MASAAAAVRKVISTSGSPPSSSASASGMAASTESMAMTGTIPQLAIVSKTRWSGMAFLVLCWNDDLNEW